MTWTTGAIRPKNPLEIEFGGRVYKGWVSDIFRAIIKISGYAGEQLEQGWEQEVWQKLHEKYPKFIIKKEDAPPPPQVSVSTIVSFIQFMSRRGWDKTVVSEEEAKARADKCGECPLAGPMTGCTRCRAAARAMIHVPDTVKLPPDKSGCTVCGCFNELKIWIPRDQLEDHPEWEWWDRCWMREP